MKKALLLSLTTICALVITGCGSTPNTASNSASAPAPTDAYSVSSVFATQFEACRSTPKSCDLDRDAVIEGTITKINGPDFWDLSNFVDLATIDWGTSSIPLLTDTQQKRATIIVDASGEIVAFEDIVVGDKIKASVKSFDIFEAGTLKEKLGQFGYIQVTAQ